jgi:16S rRNA (guanine(966)-N(2))-methyltransferase RsmD
MVRVIAGKAKGRKLKTIDSEGTKPTLNRVKEAMFSMLTPYIPCGKVLDLFSGNGGLGIEALSRGADFCIFNDKSRDCVKNIKENLKTIGFEEESTVYCMDYREVLSCMKKQGVKFELILLDPPYGMGLAADALCAVSECGIFSGAKTGELPCVAMAEHSSEDEMPDICGAFRKIKTKTYGTVGISLYEADGGAVR